MLLIKSQSSVQHVTLVKLYSSGEFNALNESCPVVIRVWALCIRRIKYVGATLPSHAVVVPLYSRSTYLQPTLTMHQKSSAKPRFGIVICPWQSCFDGFGSPCRLGMITCLLSLQDSRIGNFIRLKQCLEDRSPLFARQVTKLLAGSSDQYEISHLSSARSSCETKHYYLCRCFTPILTWRAMSV